MDEIVMAVGGVLSLWFVQHTVHICTHSQACTCTALYMYVHCLFDRCTTVQL